MKAKEILDSVDLEELSDSDLLDHLDRVSESLKKRNSLFPKSGPSPVDGILDILRGATATPPSRGPGGR